MAGTSTKFTEQSEQLVSAAREAAIAEGHCSDQCTLPQMCVWASTHARSESRSEVSGWLGVYADALLDASCAAQRRAGDAHESSRHTVGERAQPSRSAYSTADSGPWARRWLHVARIRLHFRASRRRYEGIPLSLCLCCAVNGDVACERSRFLRRSRLSTTWA